MTLDFVSSEKQRLNIAAALECMYRDEVQNPKVGQRMIKIDYP